MVQISTRTLDALVAEQAVAAQAESAGRSLDFRTGSVFRALAESFAAVGLWMQALALRILASTRASTASEEDLDSWMADYFVFRSDAKPARGMVTFSRFTPSIPALVPLGATVRTADGAWSYAVQKDASIPSWSEAQNGYVVSPGTQSISLPVLSTASGHGANAAIGTVTLLTTSIPGIDLVGNAAGLEGGVDAETDDQLRTRFRLYIASLSRATRAAVDYAISQLQGGLSWSVIENQLPDGTARDATFTVVVDDGTGVPGQDLLTRVSGVVELVRPLGVSYAVVAPQRLLVDVSMNLVLATGADRQFVVGMVQDALAAHINALPLGSSLSYQRMGQIAFATSPEVIDVQNVTVNGGVSNIAGDPRRALRAGVVNVF